MSALLVFTVTAVQAKNLCSTAPPWQDWNTFQQTMISAQGRVIDVSDARQITTSEGQSYAMFFALVNNDPLLFRRLVRWTEDNLAQGDLTAHLPAWLWGRDAAGVWQVLDANTAADSNLWIAYNLLEAGRLWGEHSYTVLGHLMLQRMAREELVKVADFGYLLAPGKYGFSDKGVWRFNPSYLPPQLLARIVQDQPSTLWAELQANTARFLIETSPLGLAPDWVSRSDRWTHSEDDQQLGSYDAIRVYLWVGMLHQDSPDSTLLKEHFKRGLLSLGAQHLPVEKINILQGTAEGVGPVGFSAALIPLFDGTDVAQTQRQRLLETSIKDLGYYSQVLVLFGQGWDEKRYSFDRHGFLVPAWVHCYE
ncbi:cellulose synthase complex periplasmic endoglucanase BcsZ [Pseudomonas sp. C27(2019)]|uniref:cellulose synthase complex periplasmic endoglucanase BcsZ n=1 Tax=Pseudomonas sp. C27(2019) TaxID=2604941 RepID=UPI0021159444|nr:cellulose synthase complex periplasmic endoglucanase BcsZ [Pseudomonas sp. C27(2019)]